MEGVEEFTLIFIGVTGAGGVPSSARLFSPPLPSMVIPAKVEPRLRLIISPAPVAGLRTKLACCCRSVRSH